jgi:low temperature requirement protein LtrA
MVAGLIAVAVANEMAIAHPHGHASAALSLLLFGGPVLFLVAQGWYLWVVPRVRPRVIIGGAALVPVGFAASAAPPYVALVLAGATLVTLAVLGGVAGPRGQNHGAFHDGRPPQSVQEHNAPKTRSE